MSKRICFFTVKTLRFYFFYKFCSNQFNFLYEILDLTALLLTDWTDWTKAGARADSSANWATQILFTNPGGISFLKYHATYLTLKSKQIDEKSVRNIFLRNTFISLYVSKFIRVSLASFCHFLCCITFSETLRGLMRLYCSWSYPRPDNIWSHFSSM